MLYLTNDEGELVISCVKKENAARYFVFLRVTVFSGGNVQ